MTNSINSAIKKRRDETDLPQTITAGVRHLLQLDLFCQTSIFYMEEHGLLLLIKVAEQKQEHLYHII